jgi:hypothetical protein
MKSTTQLAIFTAISLVMAALSLAALGAAITSLTNNKQEETYDNNGTTDRARGLGTRGSETVAGTPPARVAGGSL